MSGTHAHPNYIKIWIWLVILLVISTVGPMLEIPIITPVSYTHLTLPTTPYV